LLLDKALGRFKARGRQRIDCQEAARRGEPPFLRAGAFTRENTIRIFYVIPIIIQDLRKSHPNGWIS
jgi:hypothetical protein